MAYPATCPNLAQYQRLSSGLLPEAELQELLGHLEGCDACASRLTQLPEPEKLVGLIRQAQARGDRDSDTAVQGLIERLSKLRPGQSPALDPPTVLPRDQTPPDRLSFPCPDCGKRINAKSEMAGKKVKCPHCQKPLRVPAGPGMTPETRAPGQMSPVEAQTRPPVATTTHNPVASVDQAAFGFLAPAQAPDELGRLGPYRVLQVLGAGGMGVVFRAEDPQLARPVALKAILPGMASSENVRQRFLREARAAAAIKHDHIVTIYQVGEDRGVLYLAMEFLEGQSLDGRLQRQGKLPLAEVLRIGREMALGLAAAHKRELIHRDIKPANVWLEGEGGRVKILDFGLARTAGEEGQLTQQGAIVGTPAYMAPEQAQGKSVDGRCDLFSLGCVLYRMACGEPPFKGTDLISTLMAVATEEPRPPHELNRTLPKTLSDLILSLLAKEPTGRPASAQAVADALQRIVEQVSRQVMRPAPAAESKERTEAMGDARSVRRRKEPEVVTARLVRRRNAKKPWLIGVGVGAGVLLLGLLVLWASGVFRVKTKDGILVVQVNEPNAEVFVDGEKVKVTWGDGGKTAEIHVKPGTRKVRIEKDGFAAYGKDVTLEDGGRQVIEATLIVPQHPPAADTRPPADRTDGFVALFNGRDLNGWKTHPTQPGNWRVDNGVLVGSGPATSHLYTERGDYQDFHLRAEARINDGGNSGLCFRTAFGPQVPQNNPRFLLGYEAQINSTHGDPNKTGSLYAGGEGALVAIRESPVPAGQWFTMEVIAQDNRIIVKVDGKTTADFTDQKRRFTTGHIALQQHNPQTVAEFRKIEIKELPGSPAADDGFVPLYNGNDLTGWLVDGGDAKAWQTGGGDLVAWGQDYKTRSYLLTERMYADFRLRLEFSLTRGAGAGIALRALRGEKMPLNQAIFDHPLFKLIDTPGTEETGTTHWVLNTTHVAPSQSADMQPAGSWNRLEIEMKGRSLQAWVNGKQIVNSTLAAGARLTDGSIPALNRPYGRIGLQRHTGTVRFRNIEIKELPAAPAALAAEPKPRNGFPVVIPEKDNGKWRVADGCLEQTTLTDRVWITFGDRQWRDYDYTVEFLRVRGNGCLLAAFRVDWEATPIGHPARACVFGLGQWGNIAHTLESWLSDGKPWRQYAQKKATVPLNTWQRARVRVRGATAQCFLNDEKLFEGTIAQHPKGCVGLMTFETCYRIRNIKVTDPDGKVLLEGLAALDQAWCEK
jgi:hypothetical protein